MASKYSIQYKNSSKREFRLLKVNTTLLRISKLYLKPDGRVEHNLYAVKVLLLKRLNRRVSSHQLYLLYTNLNKMSNNVTRNNSRIQFRQSNFTLPNLLPLLVSNRFAYATLTGKIICRIFFNSQVACGYHYYKLLYNFRTS